MKLRPLGKNVTELELPNGTTVLFSYKTPVAAHVPMQGYMRTEAHYSATTSRHITQWLKANGATGKHWIVPQSAIDALAQ